MHTAAAAVVSAVAAGTVFAQRMRVWRRLDQLQGEGVALVFVLVAAAMHSLSEGLGLVGWGGCVGAERVSCGVPQGVERVWARSSILGLISSKQHELFARARPPRKEGPQHRVG